jgi:predicted phage terminase large subunit-like protein
MPLTPEEELELIALLELEETDKLFRPQPGPQEMFLSTTADIALYGGAAGGGKTYALLLENLRHVDNPKFGSVIFRRNSNQVMTEGGLWDNAREIYPLRGARPKLTPRPVMLFPSGAKVSFAHLQYEDDVLGWQGSQIPLICFDELTHFSRRQFFYMLSRNRSLCGVRPYMRATTNPDADSWVSSFIAWWIDEAGYPIPDRSGVIRFFVVVDDDVKWGDSPEELSEQYDVRPEDAKSFTFIASSVHDNKILLAKDPAYLANLKALGTVEQGRLLRGNWKIRPAAGLYSPRDKAKIVAAPPSPIVAVCRAWDLAATEATTENPRPDATAGDMIGRMENGQYIVLDDNQGRWHAADVRTQVRTTAVADRTRYDFVVIRLPQDPGQAGKEQAHQYTVMLAGFPVKSRPVSGDKVLRATPFSSQWQAGNVYVLEGPWNEAYLREMDAFPTPGINDDRVDASSDAFAEVAINHQPVSEVETVTYEDLLGGEEGESLWEML